MHRNRLLLPPNRGAQQCVRRWKFCPAQPQSPLMAHEDSSTVWVRVMDGHSVIGSSAMEALIRKSTAEEAREELPIGQQTWRQ